jgi:hypothetical protein
LEQLTVTVEVDDAVAVGAMVPKARAVALMLVHAAPDMVADTAKVPVIVPACESDSVDATIVAAVSDSRTLLLNTRRLMDDIERAAT